MFHFCVDCCFPVPSIGEARHQSTSHGLGLFRWYSDSRIYLSQVSRWITKLRILKMVVVRRLDSGRFLDIFNNSFPRPHRLKNLLHVVQDNLSSDVWTINLINFEWIIALEMDSFEMVLTYVCWLQASRPNCCVIVSTLDSLTREMMILDQSGAI